MRVVLLVLVTFFVAACGQYAERSPWPAQIASMEGMTDTEKAEVRKAVESLNSLFGGQVLSFSPESETNYTISMKKSEPPTDNAQRAGYATVGIANCSVDLSAVLFREGMKEYIRPVVFHELGHCAGLEHSPDENDVMYKTTNKDGFYTEEAIERFLAAFRASAGL